MMFFQMFTNRRIAWLCIVGLLISSHTILAKETLESEPNRLKPYKFGYEIQDEKGNVQHRHEQSDGNRQTGSYGYVDANGIFRKVYYVADENGFRVKMDSNEPGMKRDLTSNLILKENNNLPNVGLGEVVTSLQSPTAYSPDGNYIADERKSASTLGSHTASALPSDQNWLTQDFQRVRSKPDSYSSDKVHSEVPDSRLPLQFAPKISTESQDRKESVYPVHFLTSPLSAYSTSPQTQPEFIASTYKSNDNLPSYSDAPKSEFPKLSLKKGASTENTRHRPQYEQAITPEAASSHPPHVYPPANNTNIRQIESPTIYSSPPVSSDTLYIREQPVTGKLSNRPLVESHALPNGNDDTVGRSHIDHTPSGQSLYPPYEYQYQLPNRAPIHQPSNVALQNAPNDYAPPLPSPKPYEPYAITRSPSVATEPSLLAGFRPLPSNQHPPSKLPRNYRLLANAGLISVHEFDDHNAPYHNHSHNQRQYYSVQPSSYGTRYPLEPPLSSSISSSRPMIDYDRYRQLVRSKLPLRNIPYRGQYQPMGRLSPTYAYNLTGRPEYQISASGYNLPDSNYNSSGSATDSATDSHTNAPIFFSRYANREQVPAKAYYDRFKEAEFSSFRPSSTPTPSRASTSGRSANYGENSSDHSRLPPDNSYAPPHDPIYRFPSRTHSSSHSSHQPSTSSISRPSTYPLPPNSITSKQPLSYYSSYPSSITANSLTSASPLYSSSSYSSTPLPPAHTLPVYGYSLAPPPEVSTSATASVEDQDLDLYNPQGAVQLSVKKRIANRYRNVPFTGHVRMSNSVYDRNRYPTASTNNQGYIAAYANQTNGRPSHVINSLEQLYRYAASDHNPTINYFKNGLKQMLPLLGSESYSIYSSADNSKRQLSSIKSNGSDISVAASAARSGREARHSDQLIEFNKLDVLNYKGEIDPESTHLRYLGKNHRHSKNTVPSVTIPVSRSKMFSTNMSEPIQSASNPIVDIIELVRTSNLVKAIPLGRVQMNESSSKKKA